MATFGRGADSIMAAIFDENVGGGIQTPGAKHLLAATQRRHAGPKQAFGELQNTFHNKKLDKEQPLATANASKPTLQDFKDKIPVVKQYEDLESIWSEMSVLKNDEIARIVYAQTPEKLLEIPPPKSVLADLKFHDDLQQFNDIKVDFLASVPDFPIDEWNDMILDF